MGKQGFVNLFVAIIAAVAGSTATWGFEYVSDLFSKDPLTPIVENISKLNSNMQKDNENISQLIEKLGNVSANDTQIQNLSTEITLQLNSIFQNSTTLMQEGNILVQASKSISEKAASHASNPVADLFLVKGKATSLCGRENTFGIQNEYFSNNRIYVTLKNKTGYMNVGEEWKFDISNGKKGLVSYLGRTNNVHEFRLVCGCE